MSGLKSIPSGVMIIGEIQSNYDTILSHDALTFLAELHRRFESTRQLLLVNRQTRAEAIDKGEFPNFLSSTLHIRNSNYTVNATIPDDLQCRHVEITGPVSRKMLINALNSGADCFMADFEDSTAPTWSNLIDGQLNLYEAVRRTINHEEKGKHYSLKPKTATLLVRPRGWHLHDAHIIIDGLPMSGSLMDFGLYFFHNVKELLKKNSGPYFYLPKMESHLEARLWNNVFVFSQEYLEIPKGTVRATVLIETILAAFEMDEIIYELRDHSAGLNCGRWDYIFSFIKKLRAHQQYVLPDRANVTMTVPFMRAYVRLLIHTCHKRGVHAMGGMSAVIPVNNDEAANAIAMDKVRADKLREVNDGHDGTWVAHPALVPLAKQIFEEKIKGPNQLRVALQPPTPQITSKDLLDVGNIQDIGITEEGILSNIRVGVGYIEPWLRGIGCVPLNNLMEDAATAEIARVQLWQWRHHQATVTKCKLTADKSVIAVTGNYLHHCIQLEKTAKRAAMPESDWKNGRFDLAFALFERMVTNSQLDEFLTLIAYPYITSTHHHEDHHKGPLKNIGSLQNMIKSTTAKLSSSL